MKIAVAGGTGCIGAAVTSSARDAGYDVVVLSRSQGVDLLDQSPAATARLATVLDGVSSVVDVTNVATAMRARSVSFFETVSRNLLRGAAAAGVRHHLALSIVGIDRVPLGYYAGKLAQERLVIAADVPWTILRATQFHEFAAQLLDRGIGPFVPLPAMRSAPVAAVEVAARLVDLASGAAQGRVTDFGGPEVLDMRELARRVARHRGLRRLVVPVRLPGRAGAALRSGGLLPEGDATHGQQTFEQWLAAQPGA